MNYGNIRKTLLALGVAVLQLPLQAQDQKSDEQLLEAQQLEDLKIDGETRLGGGKMTALPTTDALSTFLKKYESERYLLFPEQRERSIQMLDALPATWVARNSEQMEGIALSARPGEYFTFQIGVYAKDKSLRGLNVSADRLHSVNKELDELITCFNTEGTDIYGQYFAQHPDVEHGKVLPLWFGVQIPEDVKGDFETEISIKADNSVPKKVIVKIAVAGNKVENKGYNQGRRMARLNWLNSTIGASDEVSKGFTPMKHSKNSYEILGRKVELQDNGLPAAVHSYFGPNNHTLVKKASPVLSAPVRFVIAGSDGSTERFDAKDLTFVSETDAQVEWLAVSQSQNFELRLQAVAEYDGHISYQMKVKALRDVAVEDMRLELALEDEMSQYLMGLNKEGGNRPEQLDWKWEVETKSQDAVWVGGVNGGVRLKLKAEDYRRQLVNIYYEYSPLRAPKSWSNGGRGGIVVKDHEDGAMITAYSGAREVKRGEELQFDFELLLTPFKTINRDIQYGDRYFHSNSDVSTNVIDIAHKNGANVINVHHKKDINPFINYPYLDESVNDLKNFIKEAHDKGIRTKPYYTTREITINTPEIWAFRAMGGELLYPGMGADARTIINRNGPQPWLLENFEGDYIPAWKCTFGKGPYKGQQDLSVLTTPDSRLNNFYLEGLNWMCENIEIDGVYIDDSALDRKTLQRARRIMDAHRPEARIDVHSWNHFNHRAGYAACLNLYMDLLPYVDLMWLGEGRSYNKSEDYWLVEISGVPFGLTSQMLKGGGNRWRGMLFGMTARLGWHAPSPVPIYKFWDTYHIEDKVMEGFWNPDCAVSTSHKQASATVYKGDGESIIALANMSDEDLSTALEIDWKALGLKAGKVGILQPFIEDFQAEQSYTVDQLKDLKLEKGKGILLVVRNK